MYYPVSVALLYFYYWLGFKLRFQYETIYFSILSQKQPEAYLKQNKTKTKPTWKMLFYKMMVLSDGIQDRLIFLFPHSLSFGEQ